MGMFHGVGVPTNRAGQISSTGHFNWLSTVFNQLCSGAMVVVVAGAGAVFISLGEQLSCCVNGNTNVLWCNGTVPSLAETKVEKSLARLSGIEVVFNRKRWKQCYSRA
ncbi:hypothetical protein J6590_011814 [Homalodisca vitripennis]|nr:hypothetical protein J6590_011814 [Homalodisca vitripennis]